VSQWGEKESRHQGTCEKRPSLLQWLEKDFLPLNAEKTAEGCIFGGERTFSVLWTRAEGVASFQPKKKKRRKGKKESRGHKEGGLFSAQKGESMFSRRKGDDRMMQKVQRGKERAKGRIAVLGKGGGGERVIQQKRQKEGGGESQF